MQVSFNPSNYYQRSNLSAKKMSFSGNDENSPKNVLKEKFALLDKMSLPKRVAFLNRVAILADRNPSLIDESIIDVAIAFIPKQEDEKHNQFNYITELYRLARYARMDKEIVAKIDGAVVLANPQRALDSIKKGFSTTSRNVYGVTVDINEALGYVSGTKKINNYIKKKINGQ